MTISLRQRAIRGAAVWAAVSVAVGSVLLFTYFNVFLRQKFDADLLDRHVEVVVALNRNRDAPWLLDEALQDAAYVRPFSGQYWQVVGEDGTVYASRSLLENLLPSEPGSPAREVWVGEGPAGPVRGIRQTVTLEGGGVWEVIVASSLDELVQDRAQIRRYLLATLGIVALLGVAGAGMQTRVVLRPLTELGRDVARRWDSGSKLSEADYPDEVAPLVADVNELLERNREIVQTARRQAADLAHALKTPSAVLRNEVDAFAAGGADVARAREALDRLDAQIKRSLARMRAESSREVMAGQLNTDLRASVDRLMRLFTGLGEARQVRIEAEVPEGLVVPIDRQDLEEMLGNLLENALRWCDGRIRIRAEKMQGGVAISIEDDGPGIDADKRAEALRSGVRLDTSVAGTGLGLTIVKDLLEAYRGTLELGRSDDLGGLRATLVLPARPAGRAAAPPA